MVGMAVDFILEGFAKNCFLAEPLIVFYTSVGHVNLSFHTLICRWLHASYESLGSKK